MLGGFSARRRGLFLVFIANVLWSSAGIYARILNHLDLWTILCGRAFFGGVFISIAALVERRRGVLGPRFGLGPGAPPIAGLSAIAIAAYVGAVKTTTIAEVMVIYATLPFVTAGLAFALTGERATARTLIAACVALAGVAIMVASALGTSRLVGQAVSLIMTVSFGLMIVLQRRSPGMSMTSINALGAFIAAGFAFVFSPRLPVTPYDIGVLALFGLTTVCVSFLLFMEGAKHIPAAESGLVSMLDVVLGPLWVYLFFGESPGPMAIIGGAMVIGALIWRLAPEIGRGRNAPALW